jgi:hypothetical protein
MWRRWLRLELVQGWGLEQGDEALSWFPAVLLCGIPELGN